MDSVFDTISGMNCTKGCVLVLPGTRSTRVHVLWDILN